MDYDVISNWSQLSDSDLTPDESMSMIYHEIIFSIICLAGIIANGLIIYIIRRFKNMQSVTNIYITNWLISDIVYFLLTPCFYRIFSALEDLIIGEEIVCVSFEFGSILQLTSIVFITILCINWFLTVFTVRFGRFYIIIIVVVWLMALSGIISFSTLCMRRQYSLFSHHLLFFGFGFLMCTVVAMHITKFYTRSFDDLHEKLRLNLSLATAYVVCWWPGWLCFVASGFVQSYMVLYYISIAAACLGYLNPLVNIYIFARVNKNFRMCLWQVLRFVHRDYNDAAHNSNDSDDNFNNIHVDIHCA